MSKSKPNGVAAAPCPSFILLMIFINFLVLLELVVVASGSPVSPPQERNFKRSDPLPHFKYYNGTYDLRNKHYWASATFTGAHGYVVAAIWLFCGLGFGIFTCWRNVKTGHTNSAIFHHLDRHYVIMFLLILLFTILAIVATSFVVVENHSSVRKSVKLKNTILKAGEAVRSKIEHVIKALTMIEHLLLPYDPKTCTHLNFTAHRLENESQDIQNFIEKSGESVNRAIESSYRLYLALVIINLVLVVAALVLILLHWQPPIISIIFLCWILTAIFWVLTGFSFFIHTFAGDTCSAFWEFVQNPDENSLRSIIPCMNSTHSTETLADIGKTIHNSIAKLNSKVADVYWLLALNKQNDNRAQFQMICNPFSGGPNYTFVPGTCPKDALLIRNLPDVLSRFTCYQENSAEACKREGKFIPQGAYDEARAFSESVQGMIDMYPDLKNLTECTIVKDTFSELVKKQCRSLKLSIYLLWASMLSLSIFMVALVLSWVVRHYQEKGRSFSRCSIAPNPPR